VDKERIRLAVEEFQCDHGLKVDGVGGPDTQNKLKEVHGC
jgi:murein L,D-transpeptidase YcbB/YkuD